MGEASPWRVDVDRDRCLATGGCVHALPALFEIGPDHIAHVIAAVDGEDELLLDIIDECPTNALRLRKEDDI
ncbi:MAG TPA: ferredoxin [Pseudonocardiaceae bacterium]|jgi:ferredoxin|nr:ferredoxin [Pseudonocardiaceae bacterium]